MYHKVVIIGNLGRDPELKFLADGTAVCDFSVATNRKWSKPDGSQGEETVWFRCTAWRKTAEVITEYMKKGRQIYIEGRLNPDPTGNPRTFERNDGTTGASYEVTVEIAKFLGGAGSSGGGGGFDSGASDQSAPPAMRESEIPF
jgi:single-strand DNA-binding protein